VTPSLPAASRRPRIGVLGEKFWPSRGGTSRVVESTLRHLAERYDFTTYAFTTDEPGPEVPGVRVVRFPRPPGGSAGVFAYYARCARHARRQDLDLVHVHKTDAAFVLPRLEQRFPCIATTHEIPWTNDKWSLVGKTYFHLMERFFVRSGALLTCVSREQQRHYLERHGRDVQVVPNGVEPPVFDDGGADALLAELGVEPGYLLFAARRLIPLKGLHHLVEALHRTAFAGTLVVLGDPTHAPAYVDRVRAASAGLDVRFPGYVADRAILSSLVRRARAFVFPSEREGMSVMLLEVAASGTPVLASDIPQNTDVLGPDEALFFRSGDANDLARALAVLEADPAAALARGQNASRGVAQRFDAGAVAEQYARLYDQLLQTKHRLPTGAGSATGQDA
jgi:glycosyltransferase involved in cell wall biosynthesis